MSKAGILLENGEIFFANSNLSSSTVIGEIVFNTSMTGYQEILTDSSYASQIVVMTYPLIGNYGISDNFSESNKIQVSALIIKENSEINNENNADSLSNYLAKNSTLCISGVDTRKLTKIIRYNGSQNCLITTEKISKKHKKMLAEYSFPKDIVKKVSCTTVQKYKTENTKIANFALIDYGVKNSIIEILCQAGADVTVFPYNTNSEEILNKNFDAVMLSNGPGNPKDVDNSNIKNILGKIPVFGICLGMQIAALAMGADTYKLKFGHRGANHPVINTENEKVMITSQNHGFAVCSESLPSDITLTYKNINDDTIEGINNKTLHFEGVQFHPEAGPGTNDTKYIIKNWVKSVNRDMVNA
ncbi:glutamine-hydrolyzing carbamoyl-phosphate synthase small subunit [bacterium]|nr:glutamine-hydrolyzing carbamoyl-phosphate synthase small subunit [bacterium]